MPLCHQFLIDCQKNVNIFKEVLNNKKSHLKKLPSDAFEKLDWCKVSKQQFLSKFLLRRCRCCWVKAGNWPNLSDHDFQNKSPNGWRGCRLSLSLVQVIAAEGEQKASRALREAAEVIAESPSALQVQLRVTSLTVKAKVPWDSG